MLRMEVLFEIGDVVVWCYASEATQARNEHVRNLHVKVLRIDGDKATVADANGSEHVADVGDLYPTGEKNG